MKATASDTDRTSLCLIDAPLVLRPAPKADVDDAGNRFDTDATTDALIDHNAQLRAACPERGGSN